MSRTNITFSLDTRTLAHAKAYAARAGVPLNRVVGQLLDSLGQGLARGDSLNSTQRQLLRYSTGQASLSETVEALGVNDGGIVFAMLRELSLPFPTMEPEEARRLADAALPSLEAALKPAARRRLAARTRPAP